MHPYYFQQLYQEMKAQSEKIERLEQFLQEIRKDVNAMMDKSQTHIERLEYHFDLLKIEKLEGTLNIGMSPSSTEKSLEDITVNGQNLQEIQTDPNRAILLSNIQESVNLYLNRDISQRIKKTAEESNKQVDSKYTEMIIQDLRNQIDERIILYLDQLLADKTMNKTQIQNKVIELVKRDIDIAVQQHVERE
ncbi:spore germination protein GerPC [Paenibacillus sp. GCM10028914]|uniref:spore germination protein GerPC n=1 Tax=Paenibacillus sp. GCM10028914 TaxID=3273416 RepID=UPI003617D101